MAIHVLVSYSGGYNFSDAAIPPGKAVIEINRKDKTWFLKTTPGGSRWWQQGAEWYQGVWSGDGSRLNFYNKNYSSLSIDKNPYLTFALLNFGFPVDLTGGGKFFAFWDKNPFQDAHFWQPILTDELLKEALEELEQLEEELKWMCIQSGLDAASIIDQSGISSLAAAGTALYRGAYLECAASLLGAVPLLGKLTGGAGAAAINSAHLAEVIGKVKKLRQATELTASVNEETSLAKAIGAEKTAGSDITILKDFEAVEVAKTEVKAEKKMRDMAGQVPENCRVLNTSDNWMGLVKGQAGNALGIPQKIADALAGRRFRDFDAFREAFWKEIATNPKLSNLRQAFAYDSRNLAEMAKGNSPFVKLEHQPVLTKAGRYYKRFRTGSSNGQLEVLERYKLHHQTMIHSGGAVFDLRNLLVVTEKYHVNIILPSVHYKRVKI